MTLDSDTRKLLAWRIEIKAPYFQDLTPEQAREAMAAARKAANVTPPEIGDIENLTASKGAHSVGLRYYRPDRGRANGALPFLIFFHGGGWVIGDLESHDILCRQLVLGSGCAVIAVDYRLSPEHKYPAALEDAEIAVEWIFDNAEKLGLDAGHAGIGGDSAGGNLAAVMTLLSRDGKLPLLKFQFLAYPVTDLTMARRSYDVAAEGLPVTRETMEWFIGHYLNSDEQQTDWRASPVFARSLKGVPPAYIVSAGYDPLVDEGDAYARRLRAAGVPVKVDHYGGQIHGFLTMGAALPTAGKAVGEIGKVLKSALADGTFKGD
ncbi:MAG: alpha/beta hydrolase [Flavobacteriaceae bacterium]